MIDDELRAAWFRTRILVRIGGRTVDVDRVPAGSLAQAIHPLRLPLTVVTAWNPHGQARSRSENRSANRSLRCELRDAGLEPSVAIGRAADGSWAEAGFAVGRLGGDESLALARRWEQLAVYMLTERDVTVLTAADGTSQSRPRGRLGLEAS